MGDRSKIEWTDATWNPVRARHRQTGKVGWHCEKISPACTHCYAAAQNKQGLRGGTKEDYTAAANVDVFLDQATLQKPLHWKRPRRIFVCSMTDLFGSWVTVEMLDRIYDVMAACHQHTFQVLTKRPERMHRYHVNLAKRVAQVENNPVSWPLPNMWLGVTAENQGAADERIPWLVKTPAAVRFLSCEPLLGPVKLSPAWNHGNFDPDFDVAIDWVIVGGESGRARDIRPMHPDWARSLRDQCQTAGVPFFFKQWGEWCPATGEYGVVGHVMPDSGKMECGHRVSWIGGDGTMKHPSWHGLMGPVMAVARLGKKAAGRLLDGREWNEFPALEAV